MLKSLHRLLLYRGFIWGSVQREFQGRYRHSLLGVLWTVINPMAQILVYTVIFAQVMRAKLPGVDSTFAYSIYLCSGILTWGLFSDVVSRGVSLFVDHANLLKKISFPRATLPLIMVLSAGLNFCIIFSLFLLFLAWAGHWPGLALLFVLPVLLVQMALAVGLGVVLGILNVFFRDVGQLLGIFLQFWFWFTPVVYPLSILPESVKPWLAWNPMAAVIMAYQDIFVLHQQPAWPSLFVPCILGVLLCALGAYWFRRHAGEMVDEL
jgi:lipopolysaccharide transport system permease protein